MSDTDERAAAEAKRAAYRLGVVIGVGLATAVLALGGAYAMGVFDRPPPPRDAYPCGDQLVDIDSDPRNCDGCGIVCSRDMPVCSFGSCNCAEDTASCDDGCVDVDTDPRNCGGCDITCPEGTPCVNGSCECQRGLIACEDQHDGEAQHIVCVDTLTDAENCGECGSHCSGGAGRGCRDGVCE